MKKPLLILLCALGYTYLFYDQLPGINYLLFDALVILILGCTDPDSLFKKSVLMTGLGMLGCSAFLFIHNNTAPLLLHWISFGLFVRYFYEAELSPYLALSQQVITSFLSIFRIFRWGKLFPTEGRSSGLSWGAYVITFPVVLVFVLLYASGNELYSRLWERIWDIPWNFGLFFFFLSGLILASSIVAPTYSGIWKAFDLGCSNDLEREEADDKSPLFGTMASELRASAFLFFMLNLVTLSLHMTDLYAFIHPKIGLNHSQNVHQGVNSLILSILLAILVVVYFFRGALNFFQENRFLKGLTYAWLTQNVFLVLSTCYKDFLYIHSHGLTHKRIGVLIWLTLVAIGLLWTYLKIHQKKSAWYLVRRNSWSVYIVLLAYSGIHWDRWIVRYNTTCAQCEIDYDYFSTLDVSAIADLHVLGLPQKSHIPVEDFYAQNDRRAHYVQAYQSVGWPSYNLESERICIPFTQTHPIQ